MSGHTDARPQPTAADAAAQPAPSISRGFSLGMTLDDIHTLVVSEGLPSLGEMQLDEFVKTINPNDTTGAPIVANPLPPIPLARGTAGQNGSKTVDEVWGEMMSEMKGTPSAAAPKPEQNGYGSITAAAFLGFAGMSHAESLQVPNPIVDTGIVGTPVVAGVPAAARGEEDVKPELKAEDGAGPGEGADEDQGAPISAKERIKNARKRKAQTQEPAPEPDEDPDAKVDRMKKRMVKNRESAARSRARKQAYTSDLEREVDELKQQNLDLRKKVIMEAKVEPKPDFHMTLRRTRTGPS